MMRGALIALGGLAACVGGLSMILIWINFHGTADPVRFNRGEIYKLWGGLGGLAGIVLIVIAVSYL